MNALLEVKDLVVEYPVRGLGRAPFRAVDGVSFTIPQGKTVALVGESGSGKSTVGRAILGLAPVSSGGIRFDDREISHLGRRQRRGVAKSLQVIFQDPIGSLNPSKTIATTVLEPLYAQHELTRAEAGQRLVELLARVNMPADAGSRYPGQFSGGQRQRIAIARALAINPKLVICDEPTSALDVSTQAKVLDLLAEMQRELGLSYLFISHDLAVVRDISDQVIVLRKGQIVEAGTPKAICESPTQPYTQRLVAAAPVPDPTIQRERREIWAQMTAANLESATV